MVLSVNPFIDGERKTDLRDARLFTEVAREISKRRRTGAHIDPDEKLGLNRLATFIDTIRMTEGLSLKEFALSAHPKPFNPVYLTLLSKSLISRREITDEVLCALERLLMVPSSTLRQMFSVEEVVQPKGLWGLLRMPRIRISAPFDTFAHRAPVGVTLGAERDDSRRPEAGGSIFEEAGFSISYRQSPTEGLVVTVEPVSGSGRRAPAELKVKVVSIADGSIKAGPFGFERSRAELGQVDWKPSDRLVIESGDRG